MRLSGATPASARPAVGIGGGALSRKVASPPSSRRWRKRQRRRRASQPASTGQTSRQRRGVVRAEAAGGAKTEAFPAEAAGETLKGSGSSLHVGGEAAASEKDKASTQDASTLGGGARTWLDESPAFAARAQQSSLAAVILGGGVANPTTYPLTITRAKPAVPLGANYRLIDVPVSNCINSGIRQVFVLTQFNSLSLNQHLSRAYPTRTVGGGAINVDVLAATQTPGHMGWAVGSADAVRAHLGDIMSDSTPPHERADEFLVLAGEHLYRMDYMQLLESHKVAGADITISAVPVSLDNPALAGIDGAGLGLMRIAPDGDVLQFVEKPSDDEVKSLLAQGSAGTTAEKPLIANMGIYIFSRDVIKDLLMNHPELTDFGRDVLPFALGQGYKMHGSVFNGYWKDISTLRAFHETNLELANSHAHFSLHDREAPMYSVSRNLPPTKTVGRNNLINTLIGEGCFITDSTIRKCVLGNGTIIRSGCLLENTYIMGADPREYADVKFAEGEASWSPRSEVPPESSSDDEERVFATVSTTEDGSAALQSKEVANRSVKRSIAAQSVTIPVGVGERSVIKNAIVDRNARIGSDVRIVNMEGVHEANREADGYVISSGIVTILKNAVINNGRVI